MWGESFVLSILYLPLKRIESDILIYYIVVGVKIKYPSDNWKLR